MGGGWPGGSLRKDFRDLLFLSCCQRRGEKLSWVDVGAEPSRPLPVFMRPVPLNPFSVCGEGPTFSCAVPVPLPGAVGPGLAFRHMGERMSVVSAFPTWGRSCLMRFHWDLKVTFHWDGVQLEPRGWLLPCSAGLPTQCARGH